MTTLMTVNIEKKRARKAQIPNLGSLLRKISTNTVYLQMWPYDAFIKEGVLINAVLIKNPVPENINPVISSKISLKMKRSGRISILTMFLKKVKIRQLRVHYQKLGPQVSQSNYSRRIQWNLTLKKIRRLLNKLCCYCDKHQIPYSSAEDFTCCWH